jgi:O-antigen ligase
MTYAMRIDQLARAGLIMFAFAISWSGALYRISLLLIFLAFAGYIVLDLVGYQQSKKYPPIWRIPFDPIWGFALALSIWIMLSYFWTSGKLESYFFDTWRYIKLWMMPIFAYLMVRAFKDNQRVLIVSFCLGCVILMIPSFLDYFEVFKSIGLDAYLKGNNAYKNKASVTNLVYFRNHIVHGFHIALLFSFLIFIAPTKGNIKILYFFLAACCVFDIANLIIGKMAFFSLMLSMLIVTIYSTPNWQKKGLTVVLYCILIFIFIFIFSEEIQHRVMLIRSEAYEFFFKQNIRTSGGNRLHYWQISLGMFLDHPFIGAGAGAFRSGLEITQDPLVTKNHLHTHNEYLSQLSQFGIVGFILFLGLLISLLRACWDWRRQPVQACILAVVLIFSLNALSDSSLHNEWEGWTLVFFGGLVLSQRFTK